MATIYIYVVDRDFGFAPNPFHGFCSLATCKAVIRKMALVNDWIIGVGGRKLKATGKCIYAMKVTQKVTYNQYWESPEFNDKKPVRNGSKKMMLGDNIYFLNHESNLWYQAHSHHSLVDGGLNISNLNKDTKSDKVLLSKHFYYFGSLAPIIPAALLQELSFKNPRNHRKYQLSESENLIDWIESTYKENLNLVLGDPFNFDNSEAHYSAETNKVT